VKIDPRQAAGFLRDPGKCRLVLLYGEDEGQIRERSQALTKLVAGSLNDPFLVVELTKEGWGQIPAEMAALSMIGGRRVIVVRDAGETILSQATQALKGPGGALLILEAAGLGKGKLRSFAEANAEAASIPCYPDEGRALTDLIKAGLSESGVSIDADALAWLAQNLSGDRGVMRGEIEKLALLAGAGGRLDLDAVRICVGEGAAASGDDGLLAALGGNIEAADTAVEMAIQDGLNGVALLRMALGQLQKVHQARLRVDSGLSAADAVRAMRPPVFFRAVSATTACVSLWSSEALLRTIEEARQVEMACKQTGARQELLARRFVAGLARQAQARRRG
jgi:DNA polymerase-3 subunit delta